MDRNLEKEDEEIISLLEDVTYFNLEISPNFDALVFNASKKGIDAFLKVYGHLDIPPQSISFSQWHRPHRRWFSPDISINQKASHKDPTSFIIRCFNSYRLNELICDLRIEYISENDSHIFFVKLTNKIPILCLNQKGWKTFLTLVRHLRDHSYWFFVTSHHPLYQGPPVFELSVPKDIPQNQLLNILEFIRLEPEKTIYLDTSSDLQGNCTGLLLFSQWMDDFAVSDVEEKDICNRWNNYPENLQQKHLNYDLENPTWIYLRKTKKDSPYPFISFETLKGESEVPPEENIFIFGNQKGFLEFAEMLEQFAFSADHESFRITPPDRRLKGEEAEGGLGAQGFHYWGWYVYGGGLLSPRYRPIRFLNNAANPYPYTSECEVYMNFINDRTVMRG